MEEVKMNWLSDQDGNLLAPKTLVEAVQNAEGKSLEELLESSGNVPQHVYSIEEKVIGTWIDGKPIYEKVFEIGSKSSAYTFTIENLDKIIDYTGNCIISDYSRIIPFVQPQYNNYVIINDYKDGVVNLATNLTYTDCVLVIQYTKTTD